MTQGNNSLIFSIVPEESFQVPIHISLPYLSFTSLHFIYPPHLSTLFIIHISTLFTIHISTLFTIHISTLFTIHISLPYLPSTSLYLIYHPHLYFIYHPNLSTLFIFTFIHPPIFPYNFFHHHYHQAERCDLLNFTAPSQEVQNTWIDALNVLLNKPVCVCVSVCLLVFLFVCLFVCVGLLVCM